MCQNCKTKKWRILNSFTVGDLKNCATVDSITRKLEQVDRDHNGNLMIIFAGTGKRISENEIDQIIGDMSYEEKLEMLQKAGWDI